MEVRVSRKFDNSAGAGLKGEGMGEVEEVLEVVCLGGGLPELFLGFAIARTLRRRASPKDLVVLRTTGSSRPGTGSLDPRAPSTNTTTEKNTRAPNAPLRRQPIKQFQLCFGIDGRSQAKRWHQPRRQSRRKAFPLPPPTQQLSQSRKPPSSPSTPPSPSPPNEPTSAPSSSPQPASCSSASRA